MRERVTKAVFASFAADSLALGVHWVYNTRLIDRKYGRVKELLAPELASYHRGKPKGAMTHYGDQMFLLLASLKEEDGMDAHFMGLWRELMEEGRCYIDKASQDTLEALREGKDWMRSGAVSTDLAGASRIAPLLLLPFKSAGELVDAARNHTGLTHKSEEVKEAAGFFACTARFALDGCEPVEALSLALEEAGGTSFLREAVLEGVKSKGRDTREAIEAFGAQCDIKRALPSTVHLIARHEKSLSEALIENAMAGGDSAARGMLAGLVLGAAGGLDELSSSWVSQMIRHSEIEAMMAF